MENSDTQRVIRADLAQSEQRSGRVASGTDVADARGRCQRSEHASVLPCIVACYRSKGLGVEQTGEIVGITDLSQQGKEAFAPSAGHRR